MLTLLSLISAECCNCNLLGQTTLDREPWPPWRSWPRALQDGSSAAVVVSLFFSAALCLWEGQGWLLLPIMPAGSGRSTSSSPTSGIAPTLWLKWYSNSWVLHGGIRGPPPLSVPWLLTFGIPLSFSCLSPEKKKTQAFTLRKSLGKWSGSVVLWLCSWKKLLPLFSCSPRERQPLPQHSSFSRITSARLGKLWNMSLNTSVCPVHLELGLPATSVMARQLLRHLTLLCLGRFFGCSYPGWVPLSVRHRVLQHLPAVLWAAVRLATCSIWFSHHNHYNIWCLRGGQKFRFLLICFPVIITLNLTQLRG